MHAAVRPYIYLKEGRFLYPIAYGPVFKMAAKKDNKKQDGVEVPEQELEVAEEPVKASEPAKRSEKQSREKAKAKKQNGFVAYMKKADPIAMACFIAIILASVVVIGSYINSEYLTADSSDTASEGSTVEVEYVGSYLAYYDETGAVIFDTNIESVADETTNIFSGNWTAKEEYSLLSFSIGGSTVLKAFGDACSGHQVGDVVKVSIPASDVTDSSDSAQSYGILERIASTSMDVTLDRSGTMTLEDYNEVTGKSYTSSDFPVTYSPIEGADFYATYDSVNEVVSYSFVTVTDGDTKLATGAEITVSDVSSDSFKVTYKTAGNSVLKGLVPDADGNMQAVYFEHISGESTFTYWISDNSTQAEQKGETMYFYIKIKSIS